MSKFKKSVQDLFSSVFGRADFKSVLEDQWEYAESFDGTLLAAETEEEGTGVPATVSMDDEGMAAEGADKSNLRDLLSSSDDEDDEAETLHGAKGAPSRDRAAAPRGPDRPETADKAAPAPEAPPAEPLVPTDGIPHAAETSDLFAALAFNKPDAPYPDDVPVATLVSGKHETLDETELFPPESDTVAALEAGSTKVTSTPSEISSPDGRVHDTAPAPLVLSNPVRKPVTKPTPTPEAASAQRQKAARPTAKTTSQEERAPGKAKPRAAPQKARTEGAGSPGARKGPATAAAGSRTGGAPKKRPTSPAPDTKPAPAAPKKARQGAPPAAASRKQRTTTKPAKRELSEEELRASQVMASKLRTDARKSRRIERTASVISPVKVDSRDKITAAGPGPQAMTAQDDGTTANPSDEPEDSSDEAGVTVFDWGVGQPPSSIDDEDAIREELTLRLETLFDHLEDAGEEDILDLLIDSLEEHTVDLPPFPPTASKLMGKGGKAPDDEEVLEIVKTDPALAGNVVKVANSPFYMAAAQVSSLDSAIMRIGVNQVRRVALATVMGSSFEVEGFETVINSSRMHSLATALCGEWLAEAFEVDPAQAFLAGLLHDAGELAIYRLLRHAYDVSGGKTEPWKRNLPFVQGLARRYHPHLGALFIFSWELPSSVANSLVYHHHPYAFEVEHSNLVRLIHASNALAEITVRHGRSRTWQNSLEGWRESTPQTGNMPTTGSDGVEELPIGPVRRLLPSSYPSARVQKVIRSVLLRMDASELSGLKEDEIATLPPDE